MIPGSAKSCVAFEFESDVLISYLFQARLSLLLYPLLSSSLPPAQNHGAEDVLPNPSSRQDRSLVTANSTVASFKPHPRTCGSRPFSSIHFVDCSVLPRVEFQEVLSVQAALAKAERGTSAQGRHTRAAGQSMMHELNFEGKYRIVPGMEV
jgi:hypothetical protein